MEIRTFALVPAEANDPLGAIPLRIRIEADSTAFAISIDRGEEHAAMYVEYETPDKVTAAMTPADPGLRVSTNLFAVLSGLTQNPAGADERTEEPDAGIDEGGSIPEQVGVDGFETPF